jgi:hypothetical protein
LRRGSEGYIKHLPRLLPVGRTITLKCWKERDGGPRIHNRYVLTDIAGVQFGDSLEVGKEGEEDRVSILEERSWERLLKDYVDAPDGCGRSRAMSPYVVPRRPSGSCPFVTCESTRAPAADSTGRVLRSVQE